MSIIKVYVMVMHSFTEKSVIKLSNELEGHIMIFMQYTSVGRFLVAGLSWYLHASWLKTTQKNKITTKQEGNICVSPANCFTDYSYLHIYLFKHNALVLQELVLFQQMYWRFSAIPPHNTDVFSIMHNLPLHMSYQACVSLHRSIST